MTKLEQIEKAVTALSPEELRTFARWFEEFHADLWDRQIERDVESGRLDAFAEKALAEHRAGKTKPI
ncbi:hypothetical protein BH10PSE7_BH10PSE7_21730 [soil metagenome]